MNDKNASISEKFKMLEDGDTAKLLKSLLHKHKDLSLDAQLHAQNRTWHCLLIISALWRPRQEKVETGEGFVLAGWLVLLNQGAPGL